ncbi:MAG: DUF933 domain-containing protein, partial [Fimbriimonadaceae bacterium]|nr:DUF933 domain-containing protein [Alphaproteobacteria bacterium]
LIKKARGSDKDAKQTLELVNLALEALREGRPARSVAIPDDKKGAFNRLNLLSSKPVLYVCNVEEEAAASGNDYSRKVEEMAQAEGAAVVVISANIEAELSQLDESEQAEYLETLGLESPGLDRVIRAGYDLLDLITFFTVGPKEARAWTITKGSRAPKAAAAIHTDFERGFIRAQTIDYDDYIACNGEHGAKEAGKARDEGKDYLVKDGDVILFKFAV